MDRISTHLFNDDAQFYMRKRETMLRKVENQISSQLSVQNLRDDPISASHSTRYQSVVFRLERFEKNISQIRGHNQTAEGYLRHVVDIMQRVRELDVQFANGIYSAEDRKNVAFEIDQLLTEILESANAQDGDGSWLFSGTNTKTMPFRAVYSQFGEDESPRIVAVEYQGNIGIQRAEVNEGNIVDINIPGNHLFWAKNDRIYSQTDTENYRLNQESQISIDGQSITLQPGDTLPAIIEKINNSSAAVKASLNTVEGGIVLETTTPHQLWMKDSEGTVLQDLGLINDNRPPYNIQGEALYSSGSLFDTLIEFRDRLLDNNVSDIGGRTLQGIDQGMEHLLGSLGRYGALDTRLDFLAKRVSFNILEVKDLNVEAVGVDYAQAITELNMLEYAHRAALATAAKVIQPSLLDYLR